MAIGSATYSQGSESHELFALANRRKLSDIFSNGFNVPPILKPLLTISAIKKNNYLGIEKVFSLFDVILFVLSHFHNDDYCNPIVTHSLWYIVFKDKEHTEIIGFTSEAPNYANLSKDNAGIYSFSIKNNIQYAFVHKRIQRYLCTVKMLFDRAIATNKIILKSSLLSTKTSATDKELVKSLIKISKQKKQKVAQEDTNSLNFASTLNVDVNKQMDAILSSNHKSVLNLPLEYDITFPTGDLTQLQLLYKSMQEELGAVLEIPLTKLFGTPPVGFQSTGEYDRLSYEQTLDRIANEYVVPTLCEIATILNCSEEEKQSIKYLSTYQIEILMKLINATAGNASSQIAKMVEEYIEIKTGIKAEDSPTPAVAVDTSMDDASVNEYQETM